VLPNPLVESNFLDVASPTERRDEEVAYDIASLKRLGNFRTSLWAEAGRTTLKPDELMQLEREDVILFDETDIVLEEGSDIHGNATVRVGMGEHGGFVAEVTTDSRSVHCRLKQQA